MGINAVGLLILVAALVAVVSRRIRISFTVALVLAGILLGLAPLGSEFNLSHDLVFKLLLPPLIFEAALSIRWTNLKKELVLIAAYATVGCLLSFAAVAYGMASLARWPIAVAAVFGALISATDPVAVVALMKEVRHKGRFRLLLEAESLLNDGTAAVFFAIALAYASGASTSPGEALIQFLKMAGGGILCGAAVSGVGLLLAGSTEDHLVELSITTVVAFGSFNLAEALHVSGVLAAVTAGVVIGSFGHIANLTEKGREAVESFWEFAAFVSNSFVFVLMGIRYVHEPLIDYWPTAGIAVVLVLVARGLSMIVVSLPFARSGWKTSWLEQWGMVWGGLRGALALALVLSLPDQFPRREELVAVTFSVVAVSVVVQGLTMRPVLKRLPSQ